MKKRVAGVGVILATAAGIAMASAVSAHAETAPVGDGEGKPTTQTVAAERDDSAGTRMFDYHYVTFIFDYH